METDTSVATAGGVGVKVEEGKRGTNGNGKITLQNKCIKKCGAYIQWNISQP